MHLERRVHTGVHHQAAGVVRLFQQPAVLLARLVKTDLTCKRRVVRIIDFTVDWDEETLETLESFSSRFAWLSDIYIARFLRLKLRQSDPGFRGSLIDALNLAEKIGLVESARDWARIRELRNIAAHEYSADDYRRLYAELMRLSPHLLKIEERL